MPLTAEDVLKKLTEATEEARATIKELHQERAAALDVIKQNKKRIATAIEMEVKSAIGEISEKASAELHERLESAVGSLFKDVRARLFTSA